MAPRRSVGLDIVRIFAAVLVIICHSGYFSLGITYRALSFAGILAVELFFALSGFLVGSSLMRMAAANDPAPMIKRFYVNRAARILPLYWVSLLLMALVSHRMIPLSNLFFVQNFFPDSLGFLAVSWTLSVEMWFYVLIPPVMCLLVKILSRKFSREGAVFAAIGILCVVPFCLRVLGALHSRQDWDLGIRKQIPMRLDALVMGVFFAALKNYRPEAFRKLSRNPLCLLVSIGGMLGIYKLYGITLVDDAVFNASAPAKIFFFTVVPLLSCLLVAGLYDCPLLQKLDGCWLGKALNGLSTLTYGVYLFQLAVFSSLGPVFYPRNYWENWFGFLLSIGLTLVLAVIGYFLVERPSGKLRDKLLSRMQQTAS